MTVDEKQLRLTLNHLFQSSRNELYPALLEMLDRNSLMFRWEECDGKPVRVWSMKIGAAIEHVVAAVKDEVRAELLGLFVDGEVVFTTDMKTTPEVRRIADRSLSKHTLIAACSVPAAAPAQPSLRASVLFVHAVALRIEPPDCSGRS